MYLVGDYQARYQGLWTEGKPNGNGTYYYVDGRIYKGGWKDGLQVAKIQLTSYKCLLIFLDRSWEHDIP